MRLKLLNYMHGCFIIWSFCPLDSSCWSLIPTEVLRGQELNLIVFGDWQGLQKVMEVKSQPLNTGGLVGEWAGRGGCACMHACCPHRCCPHRCCVLLWATANTGTAHTLTFDQNRETHNFIARPDSAFLSLKKRTIHSLCLSSVGSASFWDLWSPWHFH